MLLDFPQQLSLEAYFYEWPEVCEELWGMTPPDTAPPPTTTDDP